MTAVFMAVFLLYMGEEEEDDSVALYGMGMMVMKRQRVEVEEEVAQAQAGFRFERVLPFSSISSWDLTNCSRRVLLSLNEKEAWNLRGAGLWAGLSVADRMVERSSTNSAM